MLLPPELSAEEQDQRDYDLAAAERILRRVRWEPIHGCKPPDSPYPIPWWTHWADITARGILHRFRLQNDGKIEWRTRGRCVEFYPEPPKRRKLADQPHVPGRFPCMGPRSEP